MLPNFTAMTDPSLLPFLRPQFRLSLSFDEAALACGTSRGTIRRMIDRGELTPRYMNSKPVLLVSEIRK